MMFEKKISNLLNPFIQEGLKASNETLSGNGSLKYSTSGNDFVDDFASIATYKKPRSYAEIAKTMQLLWSQNAVKAVKMILYIRLITRKTKVLVEDTYETLDTQKGQGLRHESIMRMIWLAINHSNTFKRNLHLFIAAGSWKDIITMLNIDLQYNGWNDRQLDWDFMKNVLYAGLTNPNTTHLVRKYLPTIRTNSKCNTLEAQADTLIGRWFARGLHPKLDKFTAYKYYRKFKSNGIAHEWQQLISKQLFKEIKFDKIAGRALQLLVNSKFLENQGLREDYTKWIQSKGTAKYTGFVFELFKPLEVINASWKDYSYPEIDEATKATINAQFNGLVQTGKTGENQSRFIVARDISGSMTSLAKGCGMSAYSVAKAMALYFSEFLTGPFANHYIEFATDCRMVEWKGNTPVDKWINDDNGNFGGTNFISVAKLFVELKQKGVPESDFPEGVLCVSDGDFNPAYSRRNSVTNFQKFREMLTDAGFSKEYVENFKLILWDIPNNFYGDDRSVKFEDFADYPNNFYISGYDPSVVSFIFGNSDFKASPRNASELMEVALNQELLNKVTII